MKGVDTNVLVRYFVQDDDNQLRIVTELIERLVAEEEVCFVNDIVLCELVWVLETRYQYDKEAIVLILELLFEMSLVEFEDREIVMAALELYRTNRADYSDSLLKLKNQSFGCTETYTFDKKAARLEGFTIP